MTEPRVLIIGAGLAGLSASITLAEEGLSTLVVDQAPAPGGNIHRQPIEGVKPVDLSKEQTRRWQRILAQLKNAQDKIKLRYNTRFAGLDYRGDALICNLSGESSEIVKPSGLIIATGAVERVQP
ncbi:MAG: FAD-binding protein, partial [Hyphomicrobiales bacterium]|nr:FAD-binding protein [Hyphomicrobiales bacterium]